MTQFEIVVAVDSKQGIGKNGILPWHLSADLKYFKELTSRTQSTSKQNAVIMGRKTWESIPEKFRPLTDRVNVVLSRNKDIVLPGGVLKAESLQHALAAVCDPAGHSRIEKIFVIGGAQVFQAAVEHPGCCAVHITEILREFNCDTFFPPLPARFSRVQESQLHKSEGIEYRFVRYDSSPFK